MPLTTGARLGPYEVLSVLGAGGMGEVFRARDTRLGRDVALKVLPDHFASDPERLARFQREAQVLASLNHPHIAAIHGLEEVGGIRALVMELVDGDTIEERIRRGPLPLEDALPVARQIAEALEAAHEQGIVHRDLKPANVKVRPDGTVKVLDFGLAKAVEPTGATSSLSISPTITSPAMTQLGVILGTAAYMSPEQAKGKAADRRSDMWAFGCLFYEMLTGTRVFAGDDVSDTLANVLKRQPDWAALPGGTPQAIRRLLRRCLVKDPKERVADASIARIEIVDAAHESEEATPPSAVNRRRVHMTWAAAMTAVVIGAGTVVWRASSIPPALETRLEINTPATADALSFAISPDGRRLVYVALDKGQPRLWLRPLDATTAQVLAGTEGAGYPFWSPGSGSIGFFSNGKLKRVDIGGGLPRDLADAVPRGGTWNSDGVILFSRSATSGLLRIPENGGEVLPATTVDPALHHRSHRFPQFLPDGRRFLFLALGTVDTEGVYVGSLDSSEIKRVTAADAGGVYVPPGWLLFVRQGTLIAQRFDAANAELKGNPIAVADAVAFDATVQAAALSVSAGGLVAYRTGAGRRRQLTWFDRNGKSGGTLGAPDDSGISSPRMSPDARRATVQRVYQGNTDIAIVDSVRTIRLTRDPNLDRYAIWSPDSKWIVFDSNRKGTRAIYRKLSSGTGDEELLVEWPRDIVTNEWAHGYLLFSVLGDPKTGYDIGMVPLDADGKPRAKAQPWLNAGVNERGPAFSRDGRWITYNSDESNQYEVYVRSFPKGDVLVGPISTAGGIWPRWSPDMSEVYYIAADGTMMAAAISITATGIEAGAPKALFPTRIVGGGTNIDLGRQYDVAADGRFLINSVVEEGSSPIIVIQNWAPASQTHP